ncbi:MAG TPA: hypothetical protein VGM88_15530 [Kofleriaceae bacterium]|jgi:hypothetical protein
MKLLWIAIVLAAACGNGEEAGRQAAHDKAASEHHDDPAAPAVVHEGSADPAPVAKPKADPIPDPTTPAELDHALKQAMIDGRDKDVLRFCDLSKFDAKSNPQSLLGCTLSACRTKDADTAKRYAAPLAKAYMDEARKVCLSDGVSI